MRLQETRRDLDACAFHHTRVGTVSDADLIEVAQALGRVEVEARDPRPVREVSPSTEAGARPNTLSSRYGFGAFPFHTDTAYWRAPASILLLYCVAPGEGARRTLVSDVRSWGLSAKEEATLRRAVWRVDRKREAFLTRLAVRTQAGLALRYDVHCMKPIGSGTAAAALIEERAPAHAVAIEWAAGDLLVIDNRRALHARTVATQSDPERTLKRVLVKCT